MRISSASQVNQKAPGWVEDENLTGIRCAGGVLRGEDEAQLPARPLVALYPAGEPAGQPGGLGHRRPYRLDGVRQVPLIAQRQPSLDPVVPSVRAHRSYLLVPFA
jgi:hypothetical protein